MSYKLIALDLDDTLLNSKLTVTPRTLRAIHRAEEKGAMVIITTGRAYRGQTTFYKEIGLKHESICCGGAQVFSPEGKEIYSNPVCDADVRKIIEYADEIGIYFQLYLDGEYCFPKHTPYVDLYASFCGFMGTEMPYLRRLPDLTSPKVIFIDEPDRILTLQPQAMRRFPQLKLVRSKPHYLEFNNPTANKGTAVEFVAKKYGIDRSEVIAIGDSQIDLSMISYAGLGVAVANGLDEVKAKADYVAPSNDDEGVAHVIEKFVLGE